jgi:Na+-transporting methylmalonyl-CoA/oxaloacetate decarboxylase gamma subunit
MGNLREGLSVVLLGQATVFVNLMILMAVVMILGRVFGKKPKPKQKDAPPPGGAPAKQPAAGAPPA